MCERDSLPTSGPKPAAGALPGAARHGGSCLVRWRPAVAWRLFGLPPAEPTCLFTSFAHFCLSTCRNCLPIKILTFCHVRYRNLPQAIFGLSLWVWLFSYQKMFYMSKVIHLSFALCKKKIFPLQRDTPVPAFTCDVNAWMLCVYILPHLPFMPHILGAHQQSESVKGPCTIFLKMYFYLLFIISYIILRN